MKFISRKKFLFCAGAVVLLAAGFCTRRFWKRPAGNGEKNVESMPAPDRIFKVKRDNLVIGVMLTGSVNAKQKHKLAMEAPFNTKLVKVVDENKFVKAGERVAEYETYDLQLKIDDLRVKLENRRKDLEIALEELSVLQSSNESDIQTAVDNVFDAEDAYSKYWRLEGPRDRDDQKVSVSDAQRTIQDEQETLDELNETHSTATYSNQEEETKALKKIAAQEQKVSSATTKYNSQVLARKIFRRHTHPHKLKNLKKTLIRAKLNLHKTKVRCASSLLQKNKQIYQIKTEIRNYERDLARHESYMPMMVLTAPVDGIVMYGDPDRRWGNPEVKVGMDARRKQVIITIPDMSKMIVDVNLPEQYRSKIAPGAKVIVTPDSIQTIRHKGHIDHIAALPVNMIPWDSNSPKIYRSTVEFDEKKLDRRVVSGMSVQVEVVSKILKNVLFIPVEAVFEEAGKLIVYQKTFGGPVKTEITIGESNNNYVEVTKGLSEGDEVFLYRPFQTGSSK